MKIEHNISEERRKSGCPLGHCCDDCNWYRPMYRGADNGEKAQVWDCVMPILALLQDEAKNRITAVQQAVEDRGNEQIKRADAFLNLALESRDSATLPRQ